MTGLGELKDVLLAAALGLARMFAAFMLLPIFSRQVMPGMLRTAVALVFGLCAAVALYPAVKAGSFEPAHVIALVLKEVAVGFVLGFLLAIPFWALEAVGFLIDNQRGASIAATINPLTGHDTSPLGILFNQAFIVFFLAAGGLTMFLDLIYDSYRQWPVLDWWPQLRADSAQLALAQLDRMVRLAAVLAAPVLVAMFLAELGLALVSRFAPQLPVFLLAMPVKSALAMLMLGVYAATLFDYARAEIESLRGLLGPASWFLR